jgi:hypothetical protein
LIDFGDPHVSFLGTILARFVRARELSRSTGFCCLQISGAGHRSPLFVAIDAAKVIKTPDLDDAVSIRCVILTVTGSFILTEPAQCRARDSITLITFMFIAVLDCEGSHTIQTIEQ